MGEGQAGEAEAPYLDDRMEERQHEHERPEGLVRALLQGLL